MSEVGRFTDADGTEIIVAVYGSQVCLESDQTCIASLDGDHRCRLLELLDLAENQVERPTP